MQPKMTQTEKILAGASNRSSVKAGDIIDVPIDWCMTNDATTHISIDIFNKEVKNKRLFNPQKTVFVIDHNIPSESIATAAVHNKMRRFARENGIILHDGDGVCHQLLVEKYVEPGQIIIAADSHTCTSGALGAFAAGVGSTDFVAAMVTGRTWLMVPKTLRFNLTGKLSPGVTSRDVILRIIGDIGSGGATYMAMEFAGPALQHMTMSDRFVLCNLAVEAGAKSAIVASDEITKQFLFEKRGKAGGFEYLSSDPGCEYERSFDYDLSKIEPAVVGPDSLDNYDVVANAEGRPITQGFIGSCNNGRIEDLRMAASILKDRKIKADVRLLFSPASRNVYLEALREGLIETLLESGAMILNPNCSVCWGACQGVIGDGDVLISTGTRNFKGRAGSPNSVIYLSSAATVAASCIEGRIVNPKAYLP
ncbi:MAG: 3-isopropylmalate dehydratase large subunit [Thermodesulfobacteriota bacterium]